MSVLLFGGEQEYALAGITARGAELNTEEIVAALMAQARERLVHLPDMHMPEGFYLENGSRLYVDCGTHPELSTPECMNPWDAVRYVEAGHAILAGLADAVQSTRHAGTEIVLLRTNVDLSGSMATFGTHESYAHRGPLDTLRPQLIPHLVTRIVYTGAGGFDPSSPGLEFTLSPRAAHIRSIDTQSSTAERGIWHAKTESLSSTSHRLHVLCGESECSHTAVWLKFGVTALIVAMADAGLAPGSQVQLADPVAALQTVAKDTTCTALLPMNDGRLLTAIAIQRHYLRLAEANLGHDCMPPWADRVCRVWREVLDALEIDPGRMDKTLDWAIKWKLYSGHAEKRGIRWENLPALNQAIARNREAFRPRRVASRLARLAALHERLVISELPPVDPEPDANGPDSEEARALLRARDEFFEIETRFSQLGPKGIFAILDRAGVLAHRVPGADNFEHAMKHPPAEGRAMVRGTVVRRLAGKPGMQCDWQSIVDYNTGTVLDLADPFSNEETWNPIGASNIYDFGDSPEPFLERLPGDRASPPFIRREEAYRCYVQGDFSQAETLLRGCLEEGCEVPSTHCHLARTLIMQGREPEAREHIARAWEVRAAGPAYVQARILCFQCLFAMIDGGDLTVYLSRIKTLLNESCAHCDWGIEPMLDRLRARLGRSHYRFACALTSALSSRDRLANLNRFALWRNSAAG
jgi:hypothetical protein